MASLSQGLVHTLGSVPSHAGYPVRVPIQDHSYAGVPEKMLDQLGVDAASRVELEGCEDDDRWPGYVRMGHLEGQPHLALLEWDFYRPGDDDPLAFVPFRLRVGVEVTSAAKGFDSGKTCVASPKTRLDCEVPICVRSKVFGTIPA